MQSVPSEFISHLRPLMFVAGLGAEQQPPVKSKLPATSSNSSAFSVLTESLRQVFIAKRGFAIYDGNAGKGKGTDFHVVLVDKVGHYSPSLLLPC